MQEILQRLRDKTGKGYKIPEKYLAESGEFWDKSQNDTLGIDSTCRV